MTVPIIDPTPAHDPLLFPHSAVMARCPACPPARPDATRTGRPTHADPGPPFDGGPADDQPDWAEL